MFWSSRISNGNKRWTGRRRNEVSLCRQLEQLHLGLVSAPLSNSWTSPVLQRVHGRDSSCTPKTFRLAQIGQVRLPFICKIVWELAHNYTFKDSRNNPSSSLSIWLSLILSPVCYWDCPPLLWVCLVTKASLLPLIKWDGAKVPLSHLGRWRLMAWSSGCSPLELELSKFRHISSGPRIFFRHLLVLLILDHALKDPPPPPPHHEAFSRVNLHSIFCSNKKDVVCRVNKNLG